MPFVREPRLKPVPIKDLRPTQITVGMREVRDMRARWRARSGKKSREFLGEHLVPVVLGPKEHHYIIDHHHLCAALSAEKQKAVLVTVMADLSKLSRDAFYVFLDNRGWMHPFDEHGKRRSYGDLPKTVDELKDDPFRSLAGEVRRAGGFAKDATPFSEFMWADFLRRRIKHQLADKEFDKALKKALSLARSDDADYLPGWCGVV